MNDFPPYDAKKIEKKWQDIWAEQNIYATKDPGSTARKFYILDMFPYPSGEGLHVGHPKGYIATDVISRMKRMQGFNVLHPMGFDAFGLPAENYAIKTKTNPKIAVAKNIAHYKEQLEKIGFDYDWSREINTTDPAYYRWTQWIFTKLFEKGLAYESFEPINWCPVDKTGLANEDIENGRCERCGTLVEKKKLRQWVLKITDYADRLLADLDAVGADGKPLLDWPESIKEAQRNWIGRSEGVNFHCVIKDLGIKVEMYNSVPQTYRAETFTVIAPEHDLVPELVKGTPQEKEVLAFVERIKEKKALDKFDVDKEIEGVFTGRYIENYAGTGRDLPIWVASYALADYGTGMVNCSAHDIRDYAFAKKYNIPLHPVAEPLNILKEGPDAVRLDMPFVERESVVCIVKHWSEEKYLCLAWKAVDWKGFVIGGIEKGESLEDAAVREIVEEIGYKNPVFIKTLGEKVHSKFYQSVKKLNRFAHFQPVLVHLKDGEQNEIAEEEKALHDLRWVSKDEVASFINRPELNIIWDRVVGTEKPVVKNGLLTEPEEFKGREWNEVRADIIDYLVKKGYASKKVNYRLKDWVFSRQRYWGEPIPMLRTKNGSVSVSKKDLPVILPDVVSYEPTGTGESPLAGITDWVNVKIGDEVAQRETNTMPQWAGSSWYYLRYMDPHNTNALVDMTIEKYWNSVDVYVGGAEHATRHLIYARFWHKFLYDIGVVSTIEPFTKLQSVGLIMAEDGRKMSKRYNNVVNPDDIIDLYGADTLRLYEMFMGPFDQPIAWSTTNMIGSRRFLEKIWRMGNRVTRENVSLSESCDLILQKTIAKVTDDIADMKFNTAVSAMMILGNEFEKLEKIPAKEYQKVLQILAPFAPHITEDLWKMMGNTESIHVSVWPTSDHEKLSNQKLKISVQVNGKVKTFFEADVNISEESAKNTALNMDKVKELIAGKTVEKVIYVPKKLVSIVAK